MPGILLPLLSLIAFCISERSGAITSGTPDPTGLLNASCVHFEILQKKKKIKQALQEDIKPLPLPKKGGTVLEALAYCVSLLPGKNNKATLFYFLQTLSPYFCLALADKEPRFWHSETNWKSWCSL